MKKLIAICGIICNQDCPAFIATKNNDNKEKQRLSKLWASENEILKPEDITCYGCLTEAKPKTKFCTICEVRKCALDKGLKNCAYCENYPCKKYEKLIKLIESPQAKKMLDKIRETLST